MPTRRIALLALMLAACADDIVTRAGDSKPDASPDPDASSVSDGQAAGDATERQEFQRTVDLGGVADARATQGEDMLPVFLPPKDTGVSNVADGAPPPFSDVGGPPHSDAALPPPPDALRPVPDAALAMLPDAALAMLPDAAPAPPDAAPPPPDAAPTLPDAAACPPSLLQVLQPGPGQTKDIWTDQNFAYDGLGGGPGGGRDDEELWVTTSQETYLEFDLTGLPRTAERARVELFMARNLMGGPRQMRLHRVTSDWDWRVQGTGPDRERLWWADRPPTVPLGGSMLPAPSAGEWYTIDITGLYRSWQSGALPAHGIALLPGPGNDRGNVFWSGDYAGDPSLRPRLVVETAACEPPRTPCEPGRTPGLCGQVCLGTCGDGLCQIAERCEACPADCACPDGCGNGVREAGEACDDGNRVDDDLCSNGCALQTITVGSGEPEATDVSLVRVGADSLVFGWTDNAGGLPAARMQPLEATGVPLGPDVQVAADAAGEPTLIRELLPLDESTFLALFQKGPEMFGRRFSMACDLTPLDADDDFLRDVSFLPAGESRVAAALLPGGDFAVVWPSAALASADADGTAIYLRRFGADGAALDATPILVNTAYEGSQIHPTLTVDGAGNITVVWQDALDVNGWGHAIVARRFDTDGRPTGPEFRLSVPPTNVVRFPLAATLPDDVLLVVWADRSPNGTETSFQRFDRDGRSLDDVPAIANVNRAGRQQPLGLVVNHRGEFLIGYDDGQGCESGCGAEVSRGRVFRGNGQALDAGERLFPNSHAAFMAGVAMPDGDFRILYGDNNWRRAQMRQVDVVE